MATQELQMAFQNVIQECNRQIEKWGKQTHPDGTGADDAVMVCKYIREECQRAFCAGEGTWMHILDEECAEAFAESDLEKLRAELVEVAAVAVSWITDIDSRITIS